MPVRLVKCGWCNRDCYPNELRESRFLGCMVCPTCDADEPNRTLGEIQEKLKDRAAESVKEGVGWVK